MVQGRPSSKDLAVALGCLMFSSCVDHAGLDRLDETSQLAITGGAVAYGDPAVVAVELTGGGVCSGTLIAPRTVLTARHCDVSVRNGDVVFGREARLGRGVQMVETATHPSRDIRVVKLARPVLDVAPVRVADLQLGDDDVGRTLRHVGFGLDAFPMGTSGFKREITLTLSAVQPDLIHYESRDGGGGVCFGDSGGPGLIRTETGEERVVGVAALLVTEPWCYGAAADARIDVSREWLDPYVQAWEEQTCSPGDGCTSGCVPADQDCVCAYDSMCNPLCPDPILDPECPPDCGGNGVCSTEPCGAPDPDCTALGVPCTDSAQCQSRACVTQGPRRFCTRSCTADAECPDAMFCSTLYRQCMFRLQTGEPCSAGTPCFQGVCVDEGAPSRVCRKECLQSGDCAGGEQCTTEPDGPRVCRTPPPLPPDPPAGPRGCATAPGTPWLAIWVAWALALSPRRLRLLR